jgi:hypothetical protein
MSSVSLAQEHLQGGIHLLDALHPGFQFLLRLLQGGNIPYKGEGRGPPLPGDHDVVCLDAHHVPVFTNEAMRIVIGHLFAPKAPVIPIGNGLTVIRVNEIDGRPGHEFLQGITGDLRRLGVDEGQVTILADVDGILCIFQDQPHHIRWILKLYPRWMLFPCSGFCRVFSK